MKADPSQPLSTSPLPKLGIIAGGGGLPLKVIETCRDQGRPFYVLGVEGQTDLGILKGTDHSVLKAGSIGKALKTLHNNQVKELLMVGYYKRPAWHEIRPDLVGARWLAKFITQLGKDDGILRLVIQEFESEGFRVVGVKEILGNSLMAREGVYGRHKPTKEDWVSINRGFEVLHVLGQVDVGQSVVVQEGCVVGVEGMEGTDRLMLRCKGLHPAGDGGILVKIAKPHQDQRVDLPVVGPKTLEAALDAGLKGIAVQAEGVIVLDEEAIVDKANKAGLFLIGVSAGHG